MYDIHKIKNERTTCVYEIKAFKRAQSIKIFFFRGKTLGRMTNGTFLFQINFHIRCSVNLASLTRHVFFFFIKILCKNVM